MGMDPVQQGEVYEVTITIEGPVSKAAFNEFLTEINAAVDKARLKTDPPMANPPPNQPRVKVRQTRAVVRPK